MEPSHSSFKVLSGGCLFTSQLRTLSPDPCSYRFPTRHQAPRRTSLAGISIWKSRAETSTSWTLTWPTIHTAHTTISTLVPSRQEKISYSSRFLQERRATSRRILGHEVDSNDGQDSRPLG